MVVDKRALIDALIEQLESELISMKEAAQATYDAATNEESKPENEYDTRGLEASYLAGAQAKRAGEIDEVLSIFRRVEIRKFGPQDPIGVTAVVETEFHGKRGWVLLMPKGGGQRLRFQGIDIQVITPHAFLGEAMVGLKAGDVAEVEVGDKLNEYEIISVQ